MCILPNPSLLGVPGVLSRVGVEVFEPRGLLRGVLRGVLGVGVAGASPQSFRTAVQAGSISPSARTTVKWAEAPSKVRGMRYLAEYPVLCAW